MSDQLRDKADAPIKATDADAEKSWLHELQVHRIELEMQNENLRRTQVALEESLDRYRDLYDFSPMALFTLSRDGLIDEMNYTAAVLFGMERKLLLHQRFDRYIDPLNIKRWQMFFAGVFNSDLKQSCELNFRRIDRSVFPAHLDCQSLEDEQGGMTIRIALFDISDRMRAERHLRESEQKYRAIFEGTFDGIMLVDEAGMIAEYNREILQLSGMAEEQFKKMRVWEFRPADKVEFAKGVFLQIMNAGETGAAEFKYKKPDGQVIQVEARGARLMIGDRSYLKCIVRDITERKAAEMRLKEYPRLLRQLSQQGVTSREAELKRIAREIHDELGQLMTALRMDISLLRIRFAEHDPVLMNLIRDMLMLVDKAIAGIRNVSTNLRPSVLDMGLVPAISWLAEEFSKRSGASCNLRVADDMDGMNEMRTLILFRIVQESLTNAARHSQARHVEIGVKKSGDCVCIEIRDDGVGFDTIGVQEKKSFGLMGIKERALAAGGKVEVTSTPGRGTLISVDIPLMETKLGRRSDD